MYCRKCYTDLRAAAGPRCPECGTAYEVGDSTTWLMRPFPSRGTIMVQVVTTTVVASLVAYAVAVHQMIGGSGH
jgi:hypothetical protein